MGKYTDRRPEKHVEKDLTKNSVAWKGIGCLLMILIPAVSFAGAIVTINSPTGGSYIPYQLLGYPVLPDVLFSTNGLATIFSPIANTYNLYAILVVGGAYTIIFGSFISLVYAWVYRMINPKRYGPYDAPPPKVKPKKYTR